MSASNAKKDVIDAAHRIARERAREAFLDDPKRREFLGLSNLKLRNLWDPFEVRYDWDKQQYGLNVKIQNREVKKILSDDELQSELEEIVQDAYFEVMTDSDQTQAFFQDLFDDLIKR